MGDQAVEQARKPTHSPAGRGLSGDGLGTCSNQGQMLAGHTWGAQGGGEWGTHGQREGAVVGSKLGPGWLSRGTGLF